MSIQKLRLQQGWSQQQLAEASGVSVRTIQRIEAGQPASLESLKCLAAVFEVDSSTLAPERTMMNETDTVRSKEEEEAFAHVHSLRGFYLHLARYLIIVLALLALNLILFPQRMWVYWVMGGWACCPMRSGSSSRSSFSARNGNGDRWKSVWAAPCNEKQPYPDLFPHPIP